MNSDIYRIIDANINRISEGLRVLEDISRFILNDSNTGTQLKTIRQDLIDGIKAINITILSRRNTLKDYGAKHEDIKEREDIPSVISANARRVQEGLRVIEELSKLKKLNSFPAPAIYKDARFAVYDIERRLVSITCRKDLTSRITGLYFILDKEILKEINIETAADMAIKGGANIIQLRDKKGDKNIILSDAIKLKKICSRKGVIFIVNDYLDITLASNADGIHIGQTDMPVKTVRELLPIDKIIGCSTETVSLAKKAQEDGTDYIAVGAVFPTASKGDIDVVGLKTLNRIKRSVNIPVVAIGGINKDNISDTIKSGADACAVISAILLEKDIREAASSLSSIIEKAKQQV